MLVLPAFFVYDTVSLLNIFTSYVLLTYIIILGEFTHIIPSLIDIAYFHPKLIGTDTKNTVREIRCLMCLENDKCVVLFPCGHICYCLECTRETNEGSTCPMCKVKIRNACRVFL